MVRKMAPNHSKVAIYEDLAVSLATKYLISKRKLNKKVRKRKPRFWVNDYLRDRRAKGRFYTDFADLIRNPPLFKENFRMSIEQFEELLALIKSQIEPRKASRPKDFISAREKLAVTLEYLASGTLFRHMASCYRISKQHIGDLIEEVCIAIILELKELCMPVMDRRTWIENSNRFNSRWNFPNCLGSIDGKHCAIKCPPNSGSLFYNYKGFYSVVLLGIADGDYKFLYFDVGAHGSEGDSGVFRGTTFGHRLYSNQLNIPEPRILHGQLLPFHFVADDAFPLHKHIMKPYKPLSKTVPLPADERIFNYRLSRARRTVENAFGILCSRWMCLARSLFVKPSRAQHIITACVLLHNYLTEVSRCDYIPAGFGDTLLEDGTIVDGYWRQCIPEGSFFYDDHQQAASRPSDVAKRTRDHLKAYVNSTQGSLKWQNELALHTSRL